MSNIFDYIEWRDIELEKVEFNEVDNLILSRIAYFPFDGYIDEEAISLKDLYIKMDDGKEKHFLQKEDIEFFPKLANSKRFGNIILSNYINKVEPNNEKQFSAITITLPDKTIYVAYRGTDNTIVGWKEDFNMSFQDIVPSQIDAVLYLKEVAKKYRKVPIRVGGHSKGGNLAVYAAMCVEAKIKKRIIEVYNNDGPGFQEKIINSDEYKEIISKVYTYLPQTSIIGRLLNHKEKCIIIKSIQTGIMQHDLYSWQVLGDQFIKDELTSSSEFIDNTITKWLEEVTPEQRSKFIDTLFEILNATRAKTLQEMSSNWFQNAKIILRTYKNVDEESKRIILETLNALYKSARGNIKIKKPTSKNKYLTK